MRRSALSVFGLIALAACGCNHNRCDLVEMELRARELDVQQLRAELDRCEAYNCHLQKELGALKGGPVAPGTPVVAKTVGVSPVNSLALGRQTGGRSESGCAGDDCLHVHVEPRDPDGQPVKASGELVIEVLEVSRDGLKKPLSAWEIPPDQLRRSWRSGLLSTGYQLDLPWKVWPTTTKLRVVARFKPVDGRLFEAERDITVRLPPADERRIVPAAEELPSVPPDPVPADPKPAAPDARPGETGPEIAPPPRPVPPRPDVTTSAKPIARVPVSVPAVWRAVPPPPAAGLAPPVAVGAARRAAP